MGTPERTAGIGADRSYTRRRAHGPQLTDRDREIVRWVARHGVVTPELLGRRFFWRDKRHDYGKWAAYRRIRALKELGLLLSDKPFVGESSVLRVTRAGAAVAEVDLRPAPLVLSELRHSLAVVWLTEALLFEHPGAELVTERELRAARYRELREGRRETELGRAPDAIIRLPAGKSKSVSTIAVELDLSRKDTRALERMVRQYDREPVNKIWWFVTQPRLDRTQKLVERLNAAHRIEVKPWRA